MVLYIGTTNNNTQKDEHKKKGYREKKRMDIKTDLDSEDGEVLYLTPLLPPVSTRELLRTETSEPS